MTSLIKIRKHPEPQYGRTRQVLANDPFWNNRLMQLAYSEAPTNKNVLGIMKFLETKEPIKDRLMREVAKIAPHSSAARALIAELDALVSSNQTFICDGIRTFRELFEGKFTQQPPTLSSGFIQFISIPLSTFFCRASLMTDRLGPYEKQMTIAAKTFKAMELLSRDT